jgi:hypothetical protein
MARVKLWGLLRFSRILRRRLLPGRDGTRRLRQRDRAGTIRGALAHVGPLHFAAGIDYVGDGSSDESRPVTFILRADGANQLSIGIGEKSERIRIERNMRAIFLTVARDALEKFLTLVGRLDADAENLDLAFNVSFGLINKGRHLGPAPRSPTAAVEKYYRRRSLSEDLREVDD